MILLLYPGRFSKTKRYSALMFEEWNFFPHRGITSEPLPDWPPELVEEAASPLTSTMRLKIKWLAVTDLNIVFKEVTPFKKVSPL